MFEEFKTPTAKFLHYDIILIIVSSSFTILEIKPIQFAKKIFEPNNIQRRFWENSNFKAILKCLL